MNQTMRSMASTLLIYLKPSENEPFLISTSNNSKLINLFYHWLPLWGNHIKRVMTNFAQPPIVIQQIVNAPKCNRKLWIIYWILLIIQASIQYTIHRHTFSDYSPHGCVHSLGIKFIAHKGPKPSEHDFSSNVTHKSNGQSKCN